MGRLFCLSMVNVAPVIEESGRVGWTSCATMVTCSPLISADHATSTGVASLDRTSTRRTTGFAPLTDTVTS